MVELLCCDGCNKSYHLYCHVPPMLEPPHGKFICMECMAPSRKKRSRCGRCVGCLNPDCGVCAHCLDKPKFGGPGKRKSKCKERKCINMNYAQMVPASLTRPCKTVVTTKSKKQTKAVSVTPTKAKSPIQYKPKSINQTKNDRKRPLCKNNPSSKSISHENNNSCSGEKKGPNKKVKQKKMERKPVVKTEIIELEEQEEEEEEEETQIATKTTSNIRKGKSPKRSNPKGNTNVAKFNIVDLANWFICQCINQNQFQELCPLASSNEITEDEIQNIEFTRVDVMNWFKNGIIESNVMQVLYECSS